MIDQFITKLMLEKQMIGLSLAIFQDGKIIKETGYGFTDKTRNIPVTPATLFQAGSVSKPVAALSALSLMERQKLLLDTDINTQLRTWKLPENEFTKRAPVTLRHILCHRAGLTVHGFPGYAVNIAVPTLLEILDGINPANTAPIRVETVPGSKTRYSGGGYTVLQQMMIDVSGQAFPELMHAKVLKPLGMTNSTYEQPIPSENVSAFATGHDVRGNEVSGRWHVYPEMAAAGLWTAAVDLARFAIGIQHSFTGMPDSLLAQPTAQMLLTDHGDKYGLGVSLGGSGRALYFHHSGRNRGFDACLFAFANTGRDAAILTNSNNSPEVFQDILKTIFKEYHWS